MTTSATPHLTVRIPVSRVGMLRGAMRAFLAVMLLGCWLLAQAEPTAGDELPADLRAALLAMPRQESPDHGLVVTVIDGETKKALANASVFLLDSAKHKAAEARIQPLWVGPDLERGILVMLWLAGRRYETGADGKVIVPKSKDASIWVVTASGLGPGLPNRRKAAQEADELEVQVEATRDYVVRAVSANGQPLAGVPIELGTYGYNGLDRFERMRAPLTDASGQVHLRIPGYFLRMLSGRQGRLSVQVAVVGGTPVRRALGEVGKDGLLELALPPVGKVIVRLYDAQEHPRPGLKSVRLEAVNAAPKDGSIVLPVVEPQELTADFARFDFVALGQKLVARVAGEGISGQLEHTQDGPLLATETAVFAVRVTDSSPLLSLRLLGVDGKPVAKGSVSVVFEGGGSLRPQEVMTDADGRLVVALPAALQGGGGRLAIWRRHEELLADTVYGGASVVAVSAKSTGFSDLGDVRLVEEPVAVAGRLVDSDGKPLAGVVVRMSPTHAPDLGFPVPPRPTDFVPPRSLHHQATTDAEGRFTFRELEPAAQTGQLEVANGAWLLPLGTRLATGATEQRLVVTKPGVVRLSFAKKPPSPTVEVSTATGPVRAMTEMDPATGQHTLRLAPGRYDLAIDVWGRKPLRIAGVEVRAGETCTDPRLVDIDWTQGPRVITVFMRMADGGCRGGFLEWRCLDAANRVIGMNTSIVNGGTLELPEGTQRIAFGSEDCRAVFKEPVSDTLEVELVPRRRIRLALAAGLQLPQGLGVHAISPLAPDGRAVWSGNGTELLVDGDGACQVEIRSSTIEKVEGQVVLWNGTLEVPAAAEEPPTIVLPLDAAAIAAMREALAKAQKR